MKHIPCQWIYSRETTTIFWPTLSSLNPNNCLKKKKKFIYCISKSRFSHNWPSKCKYLYYDVIITSPFVMRLWQLVGCCKGSKGVVMDHLCIELLDRHTSKQTIYTLRCMGYSVFWKCDGNRVATQPLQSLCLSIRMLPLISNQAFPIYNVWWIKYDGLWWN